MIKLAVYCPRLSRETEGAWQARRSACRHYLRQLGNNDALEFETLEHLQAHTQRNRFRRIVVAQSGYYALDFWQWVRQERLDVLDVHLRGEIVTETRPDSAASHRRAHYRSAQARGETRSGRYASE